MLTFTLESGAYIKTIKPHIVGFKNIDRYGIVLFKNDYTFTSNKKNQRKVLQINIKKTNSIFPIIYNKVSFYM